MSSKTAASTVPRYFFEHVPWHACPECSLCVYTPRFVRQHFLSQAENLSASCWIIHTHLCQTVHALVRNRQWDCVTKYTLGFESFFYECHMNVSLCFRFPHSIGWTPANPWSSRWNVSLFTYCFQKSGRHVLRNAVMHFLTKMLCMKWNVFYI